MDKLLRVFELEKAVYELRYELNNRPDWVRIPVAGILRMLEEESAELQPGGVFSGKVDHSVWVAEEICNRLSCSRQSQPGVQRPSTKATETMEWTSRS